MLALSPPVFPSIGWPLEDPTVHDFHYNFYPNTHSSESFLPLPPPPPPPPPYLQQVDQVHHTTPSSTGGPDMVKKLNHNASERDRRKKINNLYSSLRSSLPVTDQKKRLSIPATVSRVIKYIPELQQQVEKLIEKKEELVSKVSKQGDLIHHHHHREKQKQGTVRSSSFAVSANRIGDRELVIQISTYKVNENPLSEILLTLMEDRFLLLNASSSMSFGGMMIYNLHFQVERDYRLDSEILSQKLLVSFCERNRDKLFP